MQPKSCLILRHDFIPIHNYGSNHENLQIPNKKCYFHQSSKFAAFNLELAWNYIIKKKFVIHVLHAFDML